MFTWAGRVYSPPTLWSLASVRSGLLVRVVWGQAITENTFPHPMVRVLYWQARRQASIQGSEMNHGCQMASAHLCFTCGGQVGLKADLQVHNSAAGGRQPCAGLGPWEGTVLTPLTWGTLSTLLKSCLFFFFFPKCVCKLFTEIPPCQGFHFALVASKKQPWVFYTHSWDLHTQGIWLGWNPAG